MSAVEASTSQPVTQDSTEPADAALDTPIARRLKNVKHIILVLSGKGGVGKSSVSTQLALALYASAPGARVGILDVDLTGPSIPRMLGVDGHPVHQSTNGWVPVYADWKLGTGARLLCMSVGFLLKNRGDSVVWRGPKKNAMIRQFLGDVRWEDLDYLVVDTPPGTSDEHLSLLEHLAPVHNRLSAVVVTTPQAVALADAVKGVSFTRAVNLPVLGVIENMSGYACPCCGEASVTNVFSKGGGESMAEREKVHFLGALPIDTQLVELLDSAALLAQTPSTQDDSSIMPPPTPPPTQATDLSPVTQLNTLSGATEPTPPTQQSTAQPSFEVLERYKQTPTWGRFKPMAEYIIEKLV